MIALTNYGNADAAVIKLLRSLKIAVDPETITAELDKHPDYPSLLAVSDVLTAFHVENVAFRIGVDELGDAPVPYLAHVKSNGGDLVLVKKIANDRYYLSSDKWDNHKVSAAEFTKMYNGVVLTANPSGQLTTSTGLATISNQVKRPALIVGALLILAAALTFHTGYFSGFTWRLALLTLFKTAGLLTSLLLLVQSIDSNNPLLQVLCQTQGKTNCNAILSSKAAKAFWGFSWSEIGFFYFAGTWLLLLFGGNTPAVWQTIVALNVISLPYTIYSIYYQCRVAKQWCVLCCTVQAVLWLEFIAIMLQNVLSKGEGWGKTTALSTIFIFLFTPVILWLTLKPLILKLQQLQPIKQQLRTFKYNTELFNRMLTAQPKYAQPDKQWCIVLGNAEANNIITMVSNPYCNPCAKTHKLLDELLAQRSDIQARVVFTANNTDGDITTPISRHLVALNELKDEIKIKQALNDWYEQKQKNYATWASLYPVILNDVVHSKIDKQHDWCQMAAVVATPTLLLNGYRLPDLYQLTDLKYML